MALIRLRAAHPLRPAPLGNPAQSARTAISVNRPIVWAITVVLAALASFTIAGSPPPQAGTVLPQSQAGPLTMQ